MTAASGYFRPGASWLHRRHPVTKLLGAAVDPAGGVPAAAAGRCRSSRSLSCSCGRGRRACSGRCSGPCASRRVLIVSILVVNALFFPGAHGLARRARAAGASRREGLDVRAASRRGGSSSRSWRRSCSCSRPSPTTCSRRSSSRGVEPSGRVRRALGGPAGARGSRSAPAPSSTPSRHAASRRRLAPRRLRALVPLVGPSPARARSSTSASGRSPSRPAGSARGRPDRLPRRRRSARSTAGCGWLHRARVASASSSSRVTGVRPMTERRRDLPPGTTRLDGATAATLAADRPLPRAHASRRSTTSTSTVGRGELARRRRADRRRQVDPRAGRAPASSRASSGPRSTGRFASPASTPSRPPARRRGRARRDRLLDAGEPAVGLQADGPRGARLRAREPRRPARRDGPPDRCGARPAGHRAPRRSRAVRALGRRAAARRDREHRRHGRRRPRPRRADRPARSRRDRRRRGRSSRELAAAGTRSSAPSTSPTVLAAADRVPRPRRGPRIALDAAGRGARRRTCSRPIGLPAADAGPARRGRRPARTPAFDEAAVAAGLARRGRRAADGRSSARADTRRPRRPGAAARPRRPVDDRGPRPRPSLPERRRGPRGVDLPSRPGEPVAIVGQNGSGKTTLAKHLDGLLRPGGGAVRIGGRDIAGEPVDRAGARPSASCSRTRTTSCSSASVRARGRLRPAQPRLDRRRRSRPASTAALVATGLADDRATNPYDLDLSRRKLVALASVLAMDPAILVLDEPTTGQDGAGHRAGRRDRRRRCAAGRTVIAITHDMEFAARHFDRIVVMRDGRVVADGPPAEVFAPAQPRCSRSTGLRPPPAARIAARLGLGPSPPRASS